MDNNLYLPNGLPVSGFKPDFLNGIWPLTFLKSDPSSIIAFLALCFGLLVASLILLYVFKAFIKNKIVRKIVVFIFALCALASIGIGIVGTQAWNAQSKINDHDMGVAVTKVNDYMKVHGLSVDNRTAWDLTCRYYDDANSHCREGQQVIVHYQSRQYKVILEKQDDSSVALIDYETLLPVFQ